MQLISKLDVIDVAAPCDADWEAMTGDDRVRHCGDCKMNVYNLSEMSEQEALKLVNEREGRLCIQFYRRADGTMITKDCPVGLRAFRKAVRQKMIRLWAKATALTGAFFVSGLFGRSAGAAEIEVEPPVPVPELIHAIKGQICVAPNVPQIQLTYDGLKMMPAKTLKEYVGKCLAKEVQLTHKMPDPDDVAAMPEVLRQELQQQVDDTSFLPTPGTKEHDALAKHTADLLKKHSDVALQIMAPQLHLPHGGPRDIIRGKMMIRPEVLPMPK